MSGRAMSQSRAGVFAAMAGIAFSVIGVAYKAGERQGVSANQIMAVLACTGLAFSLVWLFRGPSLRETLSEVPRPVWGWGLLAGITQVGAVQCVGAAFSLGMPLSPMWCAMSLSFIPVIIFSRVAYRERLDVPRLLSILAAVACVVAASLSKREASASVAAAGTANDSILLFGGVLLGVLLCNCAAHIGMKDLSMRPSKDTTCMGRFQAVYMVQLYALLAAGSIWQCAATGLPLTGMSLCLGLVAAVGSIAGVLLIMACASAPAATVFTMSGVSGILTASLVSVAAFGENISLVWLATVGLAALSIMLASRGMTPAAAPNDAPSA